MPSVLVVDDEANIRELVTVYLTAAGFDVRQAADGPAGLASALSDPPDVIVLDIMLPGMPGDEVCRRVRERLPVPVIMLSAKDRDLDKVALLELGADDYVVKPFSPPELVARVRAMLRRAGAASDAASPVAEVIEVGGLRLCPSTREASVDGAAVGLTAKEFDLLAAMAADAGVVFTRERLLERAWGFAEYVDARGVDVHIRHIREKLSDAAAAPRFVETVRGVGYRVRKDAT